MLAHVMKFCPVMRLLYGIVPISGVERLLQVLSVHVVDVRPVVHSTPPTILRKLDHIRHG